MINGQRVIALIPARGGSKSIPYKNIKNLGGKPLLAWPIDVAKQCPEIDRIIVSTDDRRIADVAMQFGAEVADRPAELATDAAVVIDTIRDLIKKLRASGETAKYMVMLEATCPLRTPADVSGCLQLLGGPGGYNSSATFVEAHLNPHRAWKINGNEPEIFIPGAVPWLPRQKLPPAFQLNGAVYAFEMDKISSDSMSLLVGKSGAIMMPRERSVDIDDEVDFLLVESLIRAGKHERS